MADYQSFLKGNGLSENTISSYVWSASFFLSQYGEINGANLDAYKVYLVDHYKPKTANLRIQGINKYLDFLRKGELRMKPVKIQQKNFLENVISDADYKFLKQRLKEDGCLSWYFVVWFMGATGARISELLKIKAEHVKNGFMDIYSKGGKSRRVYIPKRLCEEAAEWLRSEGVSSGYLFRNRHGEVLTSRAIALHLKQFANRYGIDEKVVYPHSFRHRFAKNFLEKYNDLAFLADLMGHESVETTRIYLRKTTTEQKEIVDRVVTW